MLKVCSVEGCESTVKTRGLCNPHYKRLLRYGSPTFIPVRGGDRYVNVDPKTGLRRTCEVGDCESPAAARRLCSKHLRRLKLYGDVNTALRPYGEYRRILTSGYVGVYRPGHPLAGSNGYALEHRLVMFEAGHDIAGKHVHHIDHDRANNDPANLVVLAPAEHLSRHGHIPNSGQFKRRTHCKRGHELTDENTYVCTSGRACYTCKRERWLSGKTPRTYSEEVKAAVIAAYLAGVPLSDLRASHGVSDTTVVKWVRSRGLPVRAPGRPVVRRERAA